MIYLYRYGYLLCARFLL